MKGAGYESTKGESQPRLLPFSHRTYIPEVPISTEGSENESLEGKYFPLGLPTILNVTKDPQDDDRVRPSLLDRSRPCRARSPY